jgi:hypothetical protein
MNHYSVAYMTDAFEARKNTQASMYTLGVAGVIILIFILWKIPLPVIERPVVDDLVEVNLNIPEEISPTFGGGGGGGGGNPVQAIHPAGTAYSPPQATKDEVKDVPEENDTKVPAVLKPDVVKPTAKKINSESATVKAKPKEVVETPAPQKPKAVLGKTVGGSDNGGGAVDNYSRAGGSGPGNGVGNGSGNDGGSGNGNGGGNGPGSGPGTGPKNFGTITKAISQSFDDEFNENGKVAMDLVVNERGKVVSAKFNQHGSTTSNPKLISIAERRAFELNLGSSPNGQKGTVIFNLKVKG